MVYLVLVQLLSFILVTPGWSKIDRIHAEGYLGEKQLDGYANRYDPFVSHDFYRGTFVFQDDLFFQNYFTPYLFSPGPLSDFFKSELLAAQSCTNEQLSQHFDEIRYSYRLIALSYLLEGQWHMNMLARHFNVPKACPFDLQDFLNKCSPSGPEMKKFISMVRRFAPKYEETLPTGYKKSDWWADLSRQTFKYYSHYRMQAACSGNCHPEVLERDLKRVCAEDEALMTSICSERDHIYGLSKVPDAYFLLGTSNIINTYNKQGEALGCLRRFAEVMAHKEVPYPVLGPLFKALRTHLQKLYQERFLQGRVFFFGSGKEFEEKGLKELYVLEQPLKIPELVTQESIAKPNADRAAAPQSSEKTTAKTVAEAPKKKELLEIKAPLKSAFLQAAEVRRKQKLELVEVDMLRFRYDYVFTLNMLTRLSEKLKIFMTREALREMLNLDRLGSKEAPVPLLFIKYMIDMEEHTGLYNLIHVLGDEFFVSNEIDASFKPEVEKVRLINNENINRQWQLFIVSP